MQNGRTASSGVLMFGVSALAFAAAACSNQPEREESAAKTAETTSTTTTTAATAPAPSATPAAAAAPAADNVETVDGTKYASFTGNAAAGKTAFATCRTCHVTDAGVNRIGPSLNAIVGRPAGQVAGYTYTPANKNSGITWTEEKLFQYLEKPARVVPGTKMAFAGYSEPQKRADVIAYLKNPS